MKKRLLISLICLLVIVAVNFALPRLMPGDPVLMLVGMEEDAVSDAKYEMYREKLGLDQPVLEQFIGYFGGILKGDLGYSYHYNESISSLISARIPNTLQLAIPSVVLSSLLAVLLGGWAGMGKGKKGDSALTGAMILLDAVPGFLMGMLLLIAFAYHLGWLPFGSLNAIRVPPMGKFWDRLIHLILPVTTLTLGALPGKYLMVRNTVAQARDEKYVVYARARGLSRGRIVFVHIFKNVCQPFITMVGLNFGFILSGSLVAENIFSIKGMGMLMSSAITARDYPVLQGCLLVSAVAVICANFLTDLILVALDPKVRLGVHEAR